MKIEYWPHRGSFEDSEKEKITRNSLQDALDHVVEYSEEFAGFKPFTVEDIYITHYGYDKRHQNECFLLCVGKYGVEDYLKKYKHPQCHGYLYFDVLKTKDDDGTSRFINSLFDKTMSAQDVRKFLIETCNIPEQKIEILKEYCHFINTKG